MLTTERRHAINAQETAEKIRTLLDERKAEAIEVFDVRGRSTLTDFIVIASGTSTPHLKALAGIVQREIKKAGAGTLRTSGDSESAWIVLDLYDVIVHLFLPDARAYYAVESLWRKQ